MVRGVVLCLVVAAGLFLIAKGAGVGNSTVAATTTIESTTTSDTADQSGALDVCRQRVSGQLKAPATADFGGLRALQMNPKLFQVTGYVDSQNSFGALLRADVYCEATYLGGGQWNASAEITPR